MSNEQSKQSEATSKSRKIEFELPTINFNLGRVLRFTAKGLVVFLVLSVFTLVSLVLVDEVKARHNVLGEQNLYNQNEYHIVYLDNNLFYFCKLQDFNNEFIACNDSYYLVRKSETKEDGTKEDKVYVRRPSEEELSKPEGAIYLLKENIVYIAKIGAESSVLEFINTEASK